MDFPPSRFTNLAIRPPAYVTGGTSFPRVKYSETPSMRQKLGLALRSAKALPPVMHKLFIPLTALSLSLLLAGQLAAQSPAVATLVKAGRLLDPRTGKVVSPVAVLIENGKIKEVGSPARVQADAPAGIKTIDLGGATLLPGLIDSHTHLLLDVTLPTEEEGRSVDSVEGDSQVLTVGLIDDRRQLRRIAWALASPGNWPISSRLLNKSESIS
jgi:hypothetical protein